MATSTKSPFISKTNPQEGTLLDILPHEVFSIHVIGLLEGGDVGNLATSCQLANSMIQREKKYIQATFPTEVLFKNMWVDAIRLQKHRGIDIKSFLFPIVCIGWRRDRFNIWTTMQNACQNGNIDMVKLLVENGLDATKCNGSLRDAAHANHIEIVTFILSKGASPKVDTFEGLSTQMVTLLKLCPNVTWNEQEKE